jgi:hypothetical protein
LQTSGTNTGSTAITQTDGNFVLYDTNGNALWASNTAGHPGVQTDGNLVVYDTNGNPLWPSNTGHPAQPVSSDTPKDATLIKDKDLETMKPLEPPRF